MNLVESIIELYKEGWNFSGELSARDFRGLYFKFFLINFLIACIPSMIGFANNELALTLVIILIVNGSIGGTAFRARRLRGLRFPFPIIGSIISTLSLLTMISTKSPGFDWSGMSQLGGGALGVFTSIFLIDLFLLFKGNSEEEISENGVSKRSENSIVKNPIVATSNLVYPKSQETAEIHQPKKNLADMELTENEALEIYNKIVEEIETKQMDKGLWMKALIDSDGNEARQKLLYSKHRFIKMKEEYLSNRNQ